MICDQLLASYMTRLRDDFHCRLLDNGRLCLVTPYLYPDHDNVEVFVRQKDNRVIVSDCGETLRHLDTVGMDIVGTPNYLFAAKRIAEGLGVALERGVLVKDGAPEAIGALVFDVVSACQFVASLVYGNRSYEPARFEDEVAEFLGRNNVSVERNVSVKGTSTADYKVRFRVPTHEGSVLVQTISPHTKAAVRGRVHSAFTMWSDINGQMPPEKKVSLLNDDLLEFNNAAVTILSRVSRVHKWTDRNAFLSMIKASGSASPSEPRS